MEVLVEGEKDITVGALKGFFSFLTLAGRVTWRELGHLSVPQLLHLYDGVIKTYVTCTYELN